jgi:xanthine dehydrogenase accessory factor
MDVDTLKTLNKVRQNRVAAVVVTNLQDGQDRIILEGKEISGELGEAVAKAFRSGQSRTVEISGIELFVNVHLPSPRIVVIGAVHISQALVKIAKVAGYAIEVIDPRTAFATQERFSDTQLFADWPEDVLKTRPLDAYCALAAVTHDPKIDDYALAEALKAECFYVGALGSNKTHAKRLDRLREQGITDAQMASIHSPIGLDISATGPQEIAVAIMAEIIDKFRTRGLS